jgi:hypothetical protein
MQLRVSVLLWGASAAAAGSDDSQCSVSQYIGCVVDTAQHRVLNVTAAFGTQTSDFPTMDRETCAQACCALGYVGTDVLVGVEYGVQCFCGRGFAGPQPPNATAGACSMACPGNPGESCGGSDALDVFQATCADASPSKPCAWPFVPTPAFHGCLTTNGSAPWPYCDVTMSDEERVDVLLALLDLDDLITLLSPTTPPYCVVHSAPLPAFGLPDYR